MKKKINFAFIKILLAALLLSGGGVYVYQKFLRYQYENAVLKQVVSRLEADSRMAEVLVTGVNYSEETGQTLTTIKFLEYDTNGKPLEPKYFTFSGNIIQFQSLVIRFDDIYIRKGDWFKGKSALLFWKVFMLDGKNTQEYVINPINEIPRGYKLEDMDKGAFEAQLWKNFWSYALDPQKTKNSGIKNAQIEAPGTMFIPGRLYTIKIEHDGGLRIDVQTLPSILKGEKIIG